jgi:ABC-type phosphate transport system ATPase subunit
MSIFDNVAFALREQSRKRPRRREIEPQVVDALRRAGLYEEVRDDLHRPALRLSGGQQQRLCIARAIALGPEVLLMDEPCSALDPRSTETIEQLIGELRLQLAVVIVTHNLQQAHRVADRVAFMYLGRPRGARRGRAGLPRPARAAHARLRKGCVRMSEGCVRMSRGHAEQASRLPSRGTRPRAHARAGGSP